MDTQPETNTTNVLTSTDNIDYTIFFKFGIKVNNQAEALAAIYYLSKESKYTISIDLILRTLSSNFITYNVITIRNEIIACWAEDYLKSNRPDIILIPFDEMHKYKDYFTINNKVILREKSNNPSNPWHYSFSVCSFHTCCRLSNL